MAKNETNEENKGLENDLVTDPKPSKSKNVAFTPEQMNLVNEHIERLMKKHSSSSNEPLSVYGMRDPQSIETVNVKRFDGKFVIGFKNIQNDPFKKDIPKYVTTNFDPISQLRAQPFITLVLSDGTETIEKEVRLLDYYDNRDRYDAKIIKMDRKMVIEDLGTLGHSSLAVQVGDDGKPVQRPTTKAQSKKEVITFYVELPGFAEPVMFDNDPIGPLA